VAEPLLNVANLNAGYGSVKVLTDVSLRINSGEIVALIGANGAGKTTILRCLSGLLPIGSGEIFFDGQNLAAVAAHDIVRRGVAQVPEGRKIFPRLTISENLELGAFTRSNQKEIDGDLDQVFSLFPILKERRGQLGGTLSGGEQQMLAIGRALMSRPRLLLLDEPSMGVAPIVAATIFQTLAKLNNDGMTLLLVEQNATAALRISDRAYVLEIGRIILEGSGLELLDNAEVQAAYLGG